MDQITRKTIKSLARALELNDRQGFVFVVGAGCSACSGIPTATKIIERIKRLHKDDAEDLEREFHESRRGKPMYADYMEKLSPRHRQVFIRDICEVANINPASYFIGLLMKEGYVKMIIITNFDSLILRSCFAHGVYPAVYDLTQISPGEDLPQLSEPCIVYLHGQMQGFKLINSNNEVNSHNEKFDWLSRYSLSGEDLLFCGYSGLNDSFLQAIKSHSFRHVYWSTNNCREFSSSEDNLVFNF